MKVLATKTIDTPTHSLKEGEAYDVQSKVAKDWINKGIAKAYAKPKPTIAETITTNILGE